MAPTVAGGHPRATECRLCTCTPYHAAFTLRGVAVASSSDLAAASGHMPLQLPAQQATVTGTTNTPKLIIVMARVCDMDKQSSALQT